MGRDRGRARHLVQKKRIMSTSRARLTLDQKLEVLQLLGRGVTHGTLLRGGIVNRTYGIHNYLYI